MKRIVASAVLATLALATTCAVAGPTLTVYAADTRAKATVTVGLLDSRTADVTIGLLDSRAVDVFVGIIDSEAGADLVIEREQDPKKASFRLHLTDSRVADKTLYITDSRAADKTVCLRSGTRSADLVVCVKDPFLRFNKHALVAILELKGLLKKDK
jgi:hypothetical protein